MELTKRIEHLPSRYEKPIPKKYDRQPPVLKVVRAGFGTLGYIFPRQAAKIAYRLFSTPRKRARHKYSDTILEQARVFEFLFGKQLLKAYEWGRGEKTILLVHGWESRGTALRSFVPALLEQGYRVVAFDGPAHGDSPGRWVHLVLYARAIRAIINHLGGIEGLIAHSFGGAASIYSLAHLSPKTKVKRIVLIGVPNRMEKIMEGAVKTLNIPQPVARRFRNRLESIMGMPMHQADIASGYGKAQVESLMIVHDKEDHVVPLQAAKEIYESWDNAHLLIADGYGHYQIMKNPDVVERVSRFLTV